MTPPRETLPVEREDAALEPAILDQVEALTAEEEAALIGVDDPSAGPEDLVVVAPRRHELGRSWAFDFAEGITGRFISSSARGPMETRGRQTLIYWIEKCLRTDRGAHPIHHADYGMDRHNLLVGRHPDQADLFDLEDRVREAVLYHPRIVGIEDFVAEFVEDEEELRVAFRVLLDDGERVDVPDLGLGG